MGAYTQAELKEQSRAIYGGVAFPEKTHYGQTFSSRKDVLYRTDTKDEH